MTEVSPGSHERIVEMLLNQIAGHKCRKSWERGDSRPPAASADEHQNVVEILLGENATASKNFALEHALTNVTRKGSGYCKATLKAKSIATSKRRGRIIFKWDW